MFLSNILFSILVCLRSTCLWKLLKTNNEKTSDSNLIFRSPSVVLARTES